MFSVRNILIEASKVLESLAEVSGVQSFLLAVDPSNPHDAGFLGGSLIGREYYRGLRGGGTAGAGSFKTYAQKRAPSSRDEADTRESSVRSSPAPPTFRSARQAKVELYEAIRLQLRTVSGIRKAEMKWANPERLSLYGVRMIGWPSDIPAANPSSLKASQNQKLLELVEQGELRFEKTTITGLEAHGTSQSTSDVAADDFSWAYDAEGDRGTGAGRIYGTTAAAKSVSDAMRPLLLDPSTLSGSADAVSVQEDNQGSIFSWKGNNDDLLTAEHNGVTEFDEYGIRVEPWNDMVRFDEPDGDDSPIEPRARKRARSMESEGR
ncbi:hypothetical protein P691DRAFT_424043 [Macrolepiota fuliginosa MF-IS2]|uniref:Uncharacterized protein n=1 Tax=Macrolepiota fuliginosa MF-IS2 TaxID=1400762 RepID=A0A9P5XIA1_9AGAR|nr:hypothetical protein P691DRAFT_424043 [Macrolepiota fuliginosa MF-IS2]